MPPIGSGRSRPALPGKGLTLVVMGQHQLEHPSQMHSGATIPLGLSVQNTAVHVYTYTPVIFFKSISD